MASRAESRLSRLNSAASSQQGPDKASVDEVCFHFPLPLEGWVKNLCHFQRRCKLKLWLHITIFCATFLAVIKLQLL